MGDLTPSVIQKKQVSDKETYTFSKDIDKCFIIFAGARDISTMNGHSAPILSGSGNIQTLSFIQGYHYGSLATYVCYATDIKENATLTFNMGGSNGMYIANVSIIELV